MTESLGQAVDEECRGCGASGLSGFYEAFGIPVQSTVLLDTEEEANSFPTGDLRLALCEQCGLVQNVLFDESLIDYTRLTEESQAFSDTFQDFARELAHRLVDQYDLERKSVYEIGCGKGDFLALMADAGIGAGLGIDPGYLPNREFEHSVLAFEREFYGPGTDPRADLFVARHFMEHMPNVNEYLSWIADDMRASGNSSLYLEVPDTTRVLEEGAFWDIYYEHCSYFTASSLESSMRVVGLVPSRMEIGYQGQYLQAEAITGEERQPEGADAGLFPLVEHFTDSITYVFEKWASRISRYLDEGRGVALWGGSSKTVSFLSALQLDGITVVDINPHKQGKWLPTVSVEVQDPQVLNDVDPSLVIPMNPVYMNEITASVRELGLDSSVEAI